MCAHFDLQNSHEFEFPWQPNRKNTSNFTAKNVLLTFQMEQNRMFYGKMLRITTGFYTKSWFEVKSSQFLRNLLISP